MPLKDEYPTIDDRRYSDIVAEARTRIPRYTPEWTDVNDNEPGMAVVELFGWMTELLISRLGKVPQLNYLKFLELLGIELTPARPAQAEISFPVQPSFPEAYAIVPLHTQVETLQPDEQGRSVVFETERALIALTAALDAVQSDNGVSFQDLSAANGQATPGYQPFGPAPRAGAALLLGFDSVLDFPSVEINLMVWVQTRRSRGPLYASCGSTAPPPATLQWEFWDGKDWYSLDLLKDETAAFSRSGHVYLNAPPKGRMVRSPMGKVADPRYWIRARLAAGAYQNAPILLAIRTNTVGALQAETIDGEILGGSNGRPEQVLRLASAPVLDGTLRLVVDEGDGEHIWQEVGDFLASGPDDTHYLLNRTTGEIRFGDGREGRIPVANPSRRANIIARQYRFGGGLRGNVGASEISSLRGAVGGVDSALIANPFPAYGGGDEESLEQAKARVPQTLKSHQRAVTVEDFELHARAAGGIARAKALPLFHPDFPGVDVPGVVSVIVVPQPDDPTDPAPMPTEGTLRAVCAYLDGRRLATTELYVIAPSYREIAVTAELVCRDDADLAEVKQLVLTALERYFHPLTGGEDSSLEQGGSGWPFGGDIYYSLVLQRLLVPGVRRVASLELTLEGETWPVCTDVPLDANALLRNGSHALSVRYEDAT
jgi:predicted phage baseplate assembly protein